MKIVTFANALIFDRNNNVLVLWRSESHSSRANSIDLPGGGVEAKESFEDALVREVLEETGLSLRLDDLKLAYTHSQLRTPDEYLIGALYYTRLPENKPSVTTSWEHERYAWVHASELVGFSDFHQEAIAFVFDNNIITIN